MSAVNNLMTKKGWLICFFSGDRNKMDRCNISMVEGRQSNFATGQNIRPDTGFEVTPQTREGR